MENTMQSTKSSQVKPANLGSISHATLRTDDLLSAFSDELEWQIQRNADYFQSSEDTRKERDGFINLIWEAREYDEDKALASGDYETGDEIVQSLIDALNTFAGSYQYFGSHQGDGSDFGYWIDWECIQDCAYSGDVAVFAALADIPEGFTGNAVVTNDHGNSTGYRIESGEISEVYFQVV